MGGSVIEFDPTVFVTPQTIRLSSTLQLSESAGPEVIQGPGANILTISGNNAVGVFQLDSGTTANISCLTISGGLSGNGGGIENSGALTLSDSTIDGNIAVNDGGGIDNRGTLTVTESTIVNNSAIDGGGINNGGMLEVTDSTIGNNSAGFVNASSGTGSGGGFFNAGCQIDNSTIAGNFAGNGGGGVFVSSGALTIATNSTIARNYVWGNGGGIDNFGTPPPST